MLRPAFQNFYCFLLLFTLCIPAGPQAAVRASIAKAPETLKAHQVPYQKLDTVAKRWGLSLEALPGGNKNHKQFGLKNKSVRWRLEQSNREAFFDNVKTFLGFTPIVRHGTLYVSQTDIENTLAPLAVPPKRPNPKSFARILIDPGHGGSDLGTVLGKVKEKDICLKVAKKLEAALKAKRYRVSLTRTEDKNMSLDQRAQKAQHHNADLFISLHVNSAANTSAHGVETFAYTPRNQPSTAQAHLQANDRKVHLGHHSSPQNAYLAHCLQKQLLRATGAKDRGGPRYARLKVLRLLKQPSSGRACPGALVEIGFLTHPEEGERLQTPAYQDRIVEGLTRGIEAYLSN